MEITPPKLALLSADDDTLGLRPYTTRASCHFAFHVREVGGTDILVGFLADLGKSQLKWLVISRC